MSCINKLLNALALTAALASGLAVAQTSNPAAGGAVSGAPAPQAPSVEAPSAPQPGGIRSQNIFDVKPEIKPDASSDPKSMQQSNGERNRVQPGNNAPMWRPSTA